MNFKVKSVSVLFLATMVFALHAQEAVRTPFKTTLSLEIDPATFFFNGYSAHVRLQHPAFSHLLWGGGVYAMNLPAALVNMNSDNRNEDWKVRIQLGTGLFAEHHFSTINRGWFAGMQTSLQSLRIQRDELSNASDFLNVLLMPYGGYTLQPFEIPLYIKFWAGLGYTSKVSGTTSLGGKVYEVSSVTGFATLHFGYTF